MKAHELEGKLVLIERPTPAGVEEILGMAVKPMFVTEEGVATHVTVTGEILTHKIHGAAVALTVEEAVLLEAYPVEHLRVLE